MALSLLSTISTLGFLFYVKKQKDREDSKPRPPLSGNCVVFESQERMNQWAHETALPLIETEVAIFSATSDEAVIAVAQATNRIFARAIPDCWPTQSTQTRQLWKWLWCAFTKRLAYAHKIDEEVEDLVKLCEDPSFDPLLGKPEPVPGVGTPQRSRRVIALPRTNRKCGADYAHLRTTPGGRTPEDPCSGLWCNEPDCDLWAAQSLFVFDLVRAAWNKLADLGNPDVLYDQVDLYERNHADLEECEWDMAFGAGDAAEVIGTYVANINLGICALDMLNREIERQGGTPLETPVENPQDEGLFGDDDDDESPVWRWLVVAGALGLGYYGFRKLTEPSQPADVALPPTRPTTQAIDGPAAR